MILCHHVYHHVLTVSLCSVIMPCHYALSLCSVITFYLWFSSVQSLGISRSLCIPYLVSLLPPFITPCVIFLLELTTDSYRHHTYTDIHISSLHLYNIIRSASRGDNDQRLMRYGKAASYKWCICLSRGHIAPETDSRPPSFFRRHSRQTTSHP